MALHIVLVEPEIPQNTGNIARTCAAVGASLHLIHPLGFRIDEKSVRRAGLDYWDKLSVHEYPSLEAFLELHGDEQLYLFSTKAEHTYAEVSYPADAWLLFGKESKGLPEPLIIRYRDTTVRIPMVEASRSLNLSNTVAIAAYEYHRQQGFCTLLSVGELHSTTWDSLENR